MYFLYYQRYAGADWVRCGIRSKRAQAIIDWCKESIKTRELDEVRGTWAVAIDNGVSSFSSSKRSGIKFVWVMPLRALHPMFVQQTVNGKKTWVYQDVKQQRLITGSNDG